jgi:hypothetical protein
VTLTYSPQQLPADQGLHKSDWQDFAKRLRAKLGPFRFFMCGEYGEQTYRPHYHALIFGHDFTEDRKEAEQTNKQNHHKLYTSETLDKLWQKGNCVIGEVTAQSAAYVAGYILKESGNAIGRIDEATGEYWEVAPPFQLMSRRPGLGAAWSERWRSDIYPSDEVIIDGTPRGVPAYYDKLLLKHDPELCKDVKARRARYVALHPINRNRLAARELLLHAKARPRGL